MAKLTGKQQEVYTFILDYMNENGCAPSVREICAGVGLSSPSSVHAHLKSLETKGYLNKPPNKSRSLTLGEAHFVMVPVLGTVTAGEPILAVENVECYIPFDNGNKEGDFFALKVRGDSMIGAGIMEDDIVIVQNRQTADNGAIVVALVDDSATVKRLQRENGRVIFMPENPLYEPIIPENPQILGVVISLIRNL